MPPRKGTARYTRQEIVMLDDPMADRVAKDAFDSGISRSEVMRIYIEAGMSRADELAAELEGE